MNTKLPWAPLYTTYRSGQAETTVYGILYAHGQNSLVQIGNIQFPIWGRSLIKPWQLMVVYPVLNKAYPELKPAHYALMMASQQSDERQIQALHEILTIGGLSEQQLQCPACSPLKESNKSIVGNAQTPLNHPCSGKHLAYLLYLKAQKQPVEQYLQPDLTPYQLTRDLFAFLFRREFPQNQETVDGCGMPNMALRADELAQLYQWLATGLPDEILNRAPAELQPVLQSWTDIAKMMREKSEFVGGQARLDTRLMQGQWLTESTIPVNAKEGAEGLLAVGLGASPKFPEGLGILIKISAGYDPYHLETIAFALLKQLKLCTPMPRKIDACVQNEFHFNVAPLAAELTH
jgi:L-asparaginase